MTNHRTRVRAAAAAGLLGLSTLLLSACGSSSSGATAAGSTPAASASTRGAAMQAYRSCLSQHGVTMPTGRPSGRPSGGYGGGGGFGGFGGGAFGGSSPNPTMQAAMQACASLRPKGGFGGGRGGFNSSAMAAFTSCLKDHGVTLPTKGGFRALNTADPKTAAAYNTCKPLLPTRSPGASPSASATA